jgi:hypothetical protein
MDFDPTSQLFPLVLSTFPKTSQNIIVPFTITREKFTIGYSYIAGNGSGAVRFYNFYRNPDNNVFYTMVDSVSLSPYVDFTGSSYVANALAAGYVCCNSTNATLSAQMLKDYSSAQGNQITKIYSTTGSSSSGSNSDVVYALNVLSAIFVVLAFFSVVIHWFWKGRK